MPDVQIRVPLRLADMVHSNHQKVLAKMSKLWMPTGLLHRSLHLRLHLDLSPTENAIETRLAQRHAI